MGLAGSAKKAFAQSTETLKFPLKDICGRFKTLFAGNAHRHGFKVKASVRHVVFKLVCDRGELTVLSSPKRFKQYIPKYVIMCAVIL